MHSTLNTNTCRCLIERKYRGYVKDIRALLDKYSRTPKGTHTTGWTPVRGSHINRSRAPPSRDHRHERYQQENAAKGIDYMAHAPTDPISFCKTTLKLPRIVDTLSASPTAMANTWKSDILPSKWSHCQVHAFLYF